MQEILPNMQRSLFPEQVDTMSSPVLYQLLVTSAVTGKKRTEVVDLLIKRFKSDRKLLNGFNPYASWDKRYTGYHSKVAQTFWTTLVDNKCMNCGIKATHRVFSWHHREPGNKLFTIGGTQRKNKVKFIEELLKCDYLCENCHYDAHEQMGDVNGDFKAINRRRRSMLPDMSCSSD